MSKIKSQNELSKELKLEAAKLGFDPVGIARIPGSERIQLRTDALQRWLNAKHQADMGWMEAPRRKNINTLLDGVTSLLAVGLNYYTSHKQNPGTLSIARYAWGKDYHKTIEKKLKKLGRWLETQRPNCRWKACVDSAPLLDKVWAEEAGIGWIGKNSNLLNKRKGSWILLGHLLCTEPLTPDKPATPRCGQCQACIEACPTNAIVEPFVVSSQKCIAYQTIENRSSKLPNEIVDSIGSWVAGCDICQEICPWNNEIESSSEPEMQPSKWKLELTRAEALSWSDEEWKKKLQGSALKRIKPWMWRRNAEAINNHK